MKFSTKTNIDVSVFMVPEDVKWFIGVLSDSEEDDGVDVELGDFFKEQAMQALNSPKSLADELERIAKELRS